jgi:hypothetical protein
MSNGGQQKALLKLQDIPNEYIGSGSSVRLSSLIYLESSNKLITAVQHMNEEGKNTSVTLLSCDVKKGNFELIDKIGTEKGTVGVSGLSINPESEYLSVDIVSDGSDGAGGSVYVYNLKDKSKVALDTLLKDSEIDSIHSSYWFKDGLAFEVLKNGHTVNYLYNPDNGSGVQTMMSGSTPDAAVITEQGKDNEKGNVGKDNSGKDKNSNDVDNAAGTDIYVLTIPETWKTEEYPEHFVQFLSGDQAIGSIEMLMYYPDQPESQLVPNHSELIESETLDAFSSQFSKVLKMKVKETGTAAGGFSSEQLHLFFINEDKNEAYDLRFSSDYVDDETAIQIAKSFSLK